jgi:hypothetical protein
VLVLGLIFGFVADRVTHLLSSGPHRSVQADLAAAASMAPCHPAVAHKRKAHKAAHVAKAHAKHSKKHKVAAAKKHGKKVLRVASK